MIKYNIKTVNDWLYNSNPIKGMYYNGRRVYRRFVANGQPTPPTPSFDGKFKAEYSDGTSYSAACDGNTTLTTATTKPSGYVVSAMTSAVIGDCVTSIGANAFYNCRRLTSCTIGDCVTTIGGGAFWQCSSLTNIVIPTSVTSIGTQAFYGCSGMTSCTIGSGVTTISQAAFANCTSLTSCTIGSGVTTIGGGAFENCRSLTSIDIPNSVTSIDTSAFSSCSNLTSVTIPSSVTSIGNNAFYYCSSLQSITVEATTPPTLVGYHVFKNTNNCPIYVPDASVNAYKSASRWTSYASRIKPISEKPQ